MTIERLGYLVGAIGAVLFLTGFAGAGSTYTQDEIAMAGGVVVFLAGAGLVAYGIKTKQRG